MQTHIKSPRHVHVRLSWVPLGWQWESWHHRALFPPLFSDRAELFSLPECISLPCLSFPLYSAECRTRACYGYSCVFEKNNCFGIPICGTVKYGGSPSRNCWICGICMEALALNIENRRFSNYKNDWDVFSKLFRKARQGESNDRGPPKQNKVKKKAEGSEDWSSGRGKWKINTGALACFSLLHQSEWIRGKRRI